MSAGVVALSIPLFKAAPDGYFHRPQGRDPVYSFKLGDVEAALPLSGIRKEFSIEQDSEVGRMLELIERALDFVSALRLGDALPSEVLTGEPSWEITPAHRLQAYQRLTLQLATWITGEEKVLTNAEELNQIAEDPNNKRKWNEAFDEAAIRLGYTENGREQVMSLVSSLAEEIAYIEALRDRFAEILPIELKLQRLRRLYARENSVREIADAVARLFGIARDRLSASFAEVDGQTGEIMSVLRKPEQQVSYIRKMRDTLFCSLAAWSDMIPRWNAVPMKRDESTVALLRETYRFLAPRYMPAVEWLRLTHSSAKRQNAKVGTSVIWSTASKAR
jgi:hypothetical protein